MVIRRVPGDFVVEEVLGGGLLAKPGEHAVYVLEKTSLTTPDACQRLARELGVKGNAVSYAGLKDKHAVTRQHVSVPVPRTGVVAESAGGAGWTARRVGWTGAPIDAAAIACNRFTIVVRDGTAAAMAEMALRAEKLSDGGGGLVVVNYFGDQRFASARHGGGFAAARLVKGDFEGAMRLLIGTPARKDSGPRRALTRAAAAGWGDWKSVLESVPRCPERRAVEVLARGGGFKEAFAALPNLDQVMAVEAWQSHLWNATARRMVESLAVAGELVRADDDFGEMVFPGAGAVPATWRGLDVPMLAAGTRLEGAWAEAARAVLAEEGVGVEELRVPGLRRPAFGEARRRLVVRAEELWMSEAEVDDLGRAGRLKRTVRFTLPRGAYATVVLRALGQ